MSTDPADIRRVKKPKPRPPSPRRLAVEIARTAHDRHCVDIAVLDLRGISPVTDYFVISTGTSDRQMRSVADEVVTEAAKSGQPVFKVAGLDSANWILLDFVDVVVHFFDTEYRRHYDLELIWGDARSVRWRRPQRRHGKDAKGNDDGS